MTAFAPQSRFRPRLLAKGTRVMAAGRYPGKVDGMTALGDYVVLFEEPVRFPTLKVQVERASFSPSVVVEIK